MKYLKLEIKVGKSGAYSKTMEYEDPFDTKESYGLWVKHTPFTVMPKTKVLISQTWNDENGDDVFLSDAGAKCEAYDWPVDFVYLENDGLAHERITEFINRIHGKWLRIQDSYSKMTRDGVYVSEVNMEPRFKRRGNKDLVIFSVTFRVNNPNCLEEF
jgi:hypothetical protein